MTTGAELASISPKKVLAFEDFGERMLDYLRQLSEDSIKRRWPDDGAFGLVKLGLADDGANRVKITGAPIQATDGLGRVLDLSTSAESNAAVFANVGATTYEVGMAQCDEPIDVQVNPRTGLPEYTYFREEIGFQAEPDGVSDSGSDLTFKVNSVCGPDDSTGRVVRVFKKVPGPGATTKVVAIQELTVSFVGADNEVTTTDGTFMGQAASHSLVAADYWVQLVGISVQSGTSISTGGYFFVGTVLGNGGTPTVFDTSGQKLLTTQAASEVTFIPYVGPAPISMPIVATTVQTAIQELVDKFSEVGGGSGGGGGSQYVGVDSTNFTTSVITHGIDQGGIGTTGNPDDPSALKAALENVDKRLIERRAFAAIMVDGAVRTRGDLSGANAVDKVNVFGDGGRYLIHEDGGADYEFSASTGFGAAAENPEVMGAEAVGGYNGYPTVAVPDGASAEHVLRGNLRRLHLKSNDITATVRGYKLGFNGTLGGLTMEDCGVDAGHAIFRGFDGSNVNPQRAIVIRNVEFAPGAAKGPFETALSLVQSEGDACGVIFENCVIRGPHSGASAASAVLEIKDFDPVSSPIELGFITFKDCQVIHEDDVNIPTVLLDNCNQQFAINFENCDIHGLADQDQPAMSIGPTDGVTVNMDNVRVHGKGGMIVHAPAVRGVWRNVDLRCGTVARSLAFTTAQAFSGAAQGGAWVLEDIKVALAASINTSGQTAPYIELGGALGAKDTSTERYFVRNMQVSTSFSPEATVVGFWANDENRQNRVDGCDVFFTSTGWGSATIQASGNLVRTSAVEFVNESENLTMFANNIGVYGVERQTTNEATLNVIYNQGCHLRDVMVFMGSVSSSEADIQGALYCASPGNGDDGQRSLVENFVLAGSTGALTQFLDAPIVMAGEGAVVRGVDLTKWSKATVPGGGVYVAKMSSSYQTIEDIHIGRGTVDVASADKFIDMGSGEYNQVKKLAVDQGVTTRAVEHISGTGKGQRVSDCMIRIDGSAHANVVNLTGAVSKVHDNIFLSADGTVPTITNSGTDSDSSDNILAINQ